MARITDIPHRIVNVGGVASTTTIAVYQAGTSTTIPLYGDEALSIPLANPLMIAAGNPIPPIFHGFSGEVRVEVVDASGTLFDDDPYDRPVGELELAAPTGADMVGFVQAGTGSVQRTVLAKMRDIINVRDFGAVGDNIADDTVAIQTALDALSPGQTLVLGNGKFKVSAAIALSGVDDIEIDGAGATIAETSAAIVNTLAFTNCSRLVVRGLNFTGVEDYAYFAADKPVPDEGQPAQSFLRLSACDGAVVSGCTGSHKRRFIELYSCTNSQVTNVSFRGFFQQLSCGVQADGNNAPCVTFSACQKCIASGIAANHTGSAFLNVQNGSFISVANVIGSDMHDSVVYVSSGHSVTVTGAVGTDVAGQCVKMRGYNHTVMASVAERCLQGGISLTGNGPADTFGANGHNLVALGNTIHGCGSDGISIGVQDKLYPRDVTVIGNAISDGTSTTGFAGVRVTAVRGITVQGNSVRTMASDYGILVSGVSAGSKASEVRVSGNTAADINGSGASTRGGIRLQFLSGFNADGNLFDDIASGIGVRLSECSTGTCNGNVYDGGAVVRAPTAENNIGVVFANNIGSSMLVAGDVNYVMFNKATITGYAAIASAPPAAGVITYNGNIPYIAGGASSVADWTPIGNDGRASETAVNIASAAAAINTAGKYIGKLVFDTTNNRLMRARAATAVGSWDVVDGSASVIPA
ncbi:glycosyl hydrolase family 28-related protein [Sphingopyxis panaciterrae]